MWGRGCAMSVLIVEDDEGVRAALVDLLRDEGYDIVEAQDGATALERLRSGPLPSLILLDLMMPDMDGIEFRRRQLADPRLSRIPVIVISARPDVADCARQLRAADFLPKPMSFELLIHAVQNRAITTVGGTTPLPDRPQTLHEAWSLLHR